MVVTDILIIPQVHIQLAKTVVVEVLHKLLEENLGPLNLFVPELLVKVEMLLVILAVEEVAAGMAVAVPMIMIVMLMAVGAAAVLVMYIHHRLLLTIHPVVCLIRLIISPMLKQLLVILHLLLQQEQTKQVIQGMVIYVLQLQRLTLEIL